VEAGASGWHLPNAGAAPGPFVADDQHVTGFDGAGLDGGEGGLLPVEDPGGATVFATAVACQLHHAALRREAAPQDGEAAGGLDRRVEGTHHALAVGFAHGCEGLTEAAAVHGEGRWIQEAGVEEAPGHQAHAAGGVEVRSDETAEGLEVRQDGRAGADAVEGFQVEVNARFPGDGEEVQHGVGGTARGGHGGDGVLERGGGKKGAGAAVVAHQVQDEAAGGGGDIASGPGLRRRAGAAQGRKPQDLEGGGHGVGGELAAAGPGAGAGLVLDGLELRRGQVAVAHGLEDVLDGEVAAVHAARCRGSSVEHQPREVQPRQGHGHARVGLVAARQADHAIEGVGTAYQLDGIGD